MKIDEPVSAYEHGQLVAMVMAQKMVLGILATLIVETCPLMIAATIAHWEQMLTRSTELPGGKLATTEPMLREAIAILRQASCPAGAPPSTPRPPG